MTDLNPIYPRLSSGDIINKEISFWYTLTYYIYQRNKNNMIVNKMLYIGKTEPHIKKKLTPDMTSGIRSSDS